MSRNYWKKSAKNGNFLTLEKLNEVVETNDKKRFSFDENKTRIRANQGHSLKLEIEFEEKTPPEILFHGTAEKNIEAILRDGLKKMQRHHVHLSENIETARKVGVRYGKPVIFQIETRKMLAENFRFFVSENDVWLIDEIPPHFLTIYEEK